MLTLIRLCIPLFTLPLFIPACLPIITHVYFLYHVKSWLRMFTRFTYVYHCSFVLVYLCLPMFTPVYPCLLLSTYVYSCYLRLPLFTRASFTQVTRVYLSLPLFTCVYLCLLVFACVSFVHVYLFLVLFTGFYLCAHLLSFVYPCLIVFSYV